MKLDLGSFCFGAPLSIGGGTPSWGTAFGQSKPDLKFTCNGNESIIQAMLYKSVPTRYVSMPIGKGGKVCNGLEDDNIQLAALFEKVYVNGQRINSNYILVVYRDNSDSWAGRRTLKYGPKIEYQDSTGTIYSNTALIAAVEEELELCEGASWIVSDLFVVNQDELHLLVGVVNPEGQEIFSDTESRKKRWMEVIESLYDDNAKYIHQLNNGYIKRNIPLESTSYDNYLRALRTKPFMLLAGISGTGKSRLVRELAFKSCPTRLKDTDETTPGNYLMVEVKPNWHDSSELLGYYSHLANNGNGGYVFTPFVKFLAKAKMYPQYAFFVCLDEMNLAPVEQYFAEFLSILETRKRTDKGIKSGVLVSAEHFKNLPRANEGDGFIIKNFFPDARSIDGEYFYGHELITNGLTLPDNVFIIGTVNMDDTTHQFSRKVLDRAMTIEMNGGNLADMFGRSNALSYADHLLEWPLTKFRPKYINADEVIDEHPEFAWLIQTQLPDILAMINEVLENTPFQVSYRVLNELCIYYGVLVDSGMDSEEAKNLAIDQILLMKILPRIEGDRDMLMLDEHTCRLDKLMPFAVTEDTKKKITEMKNRLDKQEFTRFWP